MSLFGPQSGMIKGRFRVLNKGLGAEIKVWDGLSLNFGLKFLC